MKTPWSVYASPFDDKHSYAPDSNSVSYHGPVHSILDADGGLICQDADYYSDAPSVKEMEHIVLCVNAHDDLLAALIEARRIIAGYIGLPVEQCMGGEFGQINAAIAKAATS